MVKNESRTMRDQQVEIGEMRDQLSLGLRSQVLAIDVKVTQGPEMKLEAILQIAFLTALDRHASDGR